MKSHLRIVLDFYQSNNLKYVYLIENDYHYICDEPKWGDRKILKSGQMGDFIEFDPDESIASISEKYMELCEELGIIDSKGKAINKKENIPENDRSILAEIKKIGDLGTSTWHEVVYYLDGNWRCYAGSNTFKDGEKVLKWKYVEDCF